MWDKFLIWAKSENTKRVAWEVGSRVLILIGMVAVMIVVGLSRVLAATMKKHQ